MGSYIEGVPTRRGGGRRCEGTLGGRMNPVHNLSVRKGGGGDDWNVGSEEVRGGCGTAEGDKDLRPHCSDGVEQFL